MLHVECKDDITTITLENGKVNVLDIELLSELSRAFRSLHSSDGGGGAVVITGTGQRAFSAGVDLASIVKGGGDYVRAFLPALSAAILDIFQCPLPVVAAVNGHAIAGGCLLAVAADVRIMGTGKIGLPEFAVGVPLPVAGIEVLRSATGHRAAQVLNNASLMGADDARTAGLVSRVTAANVLDTAYEEADRLRMVRPSTFSLTKTQLRAPFMASIEANLGQNRAVTSAWVQAVEDGRIQQYLDSLSR